MNTQPAVSPKIILIVDDNPTNLGVLFDYLKELGHRVLVHTNGESAIAATRQMSPDIILLDVMMPGIDGFETCRRLKANNATKDIPVIFMTALTDTVDEVKGLEVGAVDYITKPIKTEIVSARINTHLALRNTQKQLEERNLQLQHALDNIKTLEGMIPICANCKQVRDDEGFWQQVEVYIRDHTDAKFSHGICPDCMESLYPDYHQRIIAQHQQEILDVLNSCEWATLEDISTTTGLSKNDTLRYLKDMLAEGVVTCLEVEGQRFYKPQTC
jgi:CheY-like chemotaxis protein